MESPGLGQGKPRNRSGGWLIKADAKNKVRKRPPFSLPVFSPGRVMLPTELKLNPPTQQFGNV